MLSSRKRKASPEKSPENSKTRKLKVSNKIFRSPTTPKPTSVAKTKINKLLPDGYESIIVTANTKFDGNVEGNETVFGCVRLPIITKEDALIWVKKFERKTSTSYRAQKAWRCDPKTGLFKRKFVCNHRIPNEPGGIYSCRACIIFTIKDVKEIQTNPDYYLRDYPSQVIIQFCHNHKIDPDLYLKNLRPSADLGVIFGTYFAKGHSPFSALICHKCDLHSAYGSEFYNVVSNGSICPSYGWCFREFEKLFLRKFVEPQEDELVEKLRDVVDKYNTECLSDSAFLSHDPLVLAVCTPLMKSVFRSGFAEDLITVRSFCTPKTVPKRQKLILFLCHTPIGSLPFGIVITFADHSETICDGIKNLLTMLGVPSYSPKTIIADENSLISKSLKKSFPESQVLFNEFQMLQSIWRIIRLVCQEDNEEFQAVYNLFLVTLNSASEEDFKSNFDGLLRYAKKYPKLTNFLKYFKLRSSSYILYARPKVEFNTDVLNYTDSGTIILQDVSIKYGSFFNILQLFDFLTISYVNHYERKLVKIADGDLKGFFKTNFFVPLSKIADFTCEKVSDTVFLVRINDIKFFVNAELDTCTCQVGVHGGSCVHQYIVEKNLGLVPECYTPLGEDMLAIFKSILSYKDTKPKEISSGLGSSKTELESFPENKFSDFISSVSSSKVATMNDITPDVENLGPVDEIYLTPSEVGDSFTDEDMSPLELSEFEDTVEDNDEFLNDSCQYNKESGELEPVASSSHTSEITDLHENGVLPPSLDEHNSATEKLSQHDSSTNNMIVYGYIQSDPKCNNKVEVMPEDSSIVLTADIGEYGVVENTGTPVVYTYTTENDDHIEIYEEVMTENDKKTAEIAEFLTNLPDTNNLNYNALTSTDPVELQDVPTLIEGNGIRKSKETSEAIKSFQQLITPARKIQTSSEGVVVMKNDEFFTQYRVMENGVLSVVTDDVYANQISTFPNNSASNFMGDCYEGTGLLMMSPTDMFDDNENIEVLNETTDTLEPKINVLSSVVIKSPITPSVSQEILIPNTPLNLNTIKHKTLRNVKEDSRNRVSEPKVPQTGNLIFVHNMLKTEPQKIILPIMAKESNVQGSSAVTVKETSDTGKTSPSDKASKYLAEECEKDVIQLYCNQPGDTSSVEQTQIEDKMKNIKDTEPLPIAESLPDKTRNVQSDVDTQELEDADEECEGMNFTECDPEQLAEANFADVIEMDSDDLEELASQEYCPGLSLSPRKEISERTENSRIKMVPLEAVPSKLLPMKKAVLTSGSSTVKAIPLRDFISKKFTNTISPEKLVGEAAQKPKRALDKKDQICTKYSKKVSFDNQQFLEGQLTTAFSQLTDLANKNNFQDSVQKFLGKIKELGTGKKLISALESFGSDLPKKECNLKNKNNTTTTNSSSSCIKPAKYLDKLTKTELKEREMPKDVNRGAILTNRAISGTTSKDSDEYHEIMARKRLGIKNWELSSDSDNNSITSDSEGFGSTEFEHYSDCRTSCSEFHSELEGITDLSDLSDYELYQVQLTNKGSSDDRSMFPKSKATSDSVKNNITNIRMNNKLPSDITITTKSNRQVESKNSEKEPFTNQTVKPTRNTKQFQSISEETNTLPLSNTSFTIEPSASKGIKTKPVEKQFRNVNEDSYLSDKITSDLPNKKLSKTSTPLSSDHLTKPDRMSETPKVTKRKPMLKGFQHIYEDSDSADEIQNELFKNIKSPVFKQTKKSETTPSKNITNITLKGAIKPKTKKFKSNIDFSKFTKRFESKVRPVEKGKLQLKPDFLSLSKSRKFDKSTNKQTTFNVAKTKSSMVENIKENGKCKKDNLAGTKLDSGVSIVSPRFANKLPETSKVTPGVTFPTNGAVSSPVPPKPTLMDIAELKLVPLKVSPAEVPEKSLMTKEAQELETILMGGLDIDANINVTSHESKVKIDGISVLESEFSFLFSDSRFEMIMEDSDVDDTNENCFSEEPPPLIYLLPPNIDSNRITLLKDKITLGCSAIPQGHIESSIKTQPFSSKSKPLRRFRPILPKPSPLVDKVILSNTEKEQGLSSSSLETTNITCGMVFHGDKKSGIMENTQSKSSGSARLDEETSKQRASELINITEKNNKGGLNGRQRSKSATRHLAREVEELRRVAEEFTKEKIRTSRSSSKKSRGNKDNLEYIKTRRTSRNYSIDAAAENTIKKLKEERPINIDLKGIEHKGRRKTMTSESDFKDKNPINKLNNKEQQHTRRKSEIMPGNKASFNSSKNRQSKIVTNPKRQGTSIEDSSQVRKQGTISKVSKLITTTPRKQATKRMDKGSVDFETTIAISVLEKEPETKKSILAQKSSILVTSTPKRPVGYEDAFKRFLETSRDCQRDISKSFSDVENYRDESDSDSNTFIRRRAKSVCSTQRSTSNFGSQRPNTSNMKKSVSWAEGLNIIEYVEESECDSDDSEIKVAPRGRAFTDVRQRELQSKKRPRLSSPVDKDFNKDGSYKRSRQRQNRSRSTSRQRANVTKRSARTRSPKLELIVLLERNIEIELLCQSLHNRTRRSSRTQHRGYKELLESATRLKYL